MVGIFHYVVTIRKDGYDIGYIFTLLERFSMNKTAERIMIELLEQTKEETTSPNKYLHAFSRKNVSVNKKYGVSITALCGYISRKKVLTPPVVGKEKCPECLIFLQFWKSVKQ